MFIVLGLIMVISLASVYVILAEDASFEAGVGAAEINKAASPEKNAAAVAEPADAYELTTLTFGGTCTPASMLGSDSYGTFNQAYKDNGADYFFAELANIFKRDDMTMVGCNAVFTDRNELATAEKESREWYRTLPEVASVFRAGDIDVLSLECERTMDYGVDGYSDTIAALEAQLLVWGDSEKAIYQTMPAGITAAIYCCTFAEDIVPEIRSWIENAAQSNDFVAIYITDSEDSYTVTEEKKNAYHSFIEAGADLVVGTNGTKLQPAEEWEDGYIIYSLGSLLDGASKYPEKYTALLDVKIKSDHGEITDISYELLSCRTYDEKNFWHPQILENGEEKTQITAFLSGRQSVPYQ